MSNQEKYAIEFNHLTKKFGEHTVLDSLDFNVHKGKITTILGFSGAGKSTLMKHILGLLLPSSGEVIVLGQDPSKLTEFDLRTFRQNFGMLFQYAALFDSMTTFENIAFPLREFTKKTESEIEEKVYSLLKQVDLHEEATFKLPSELSGGMRKRVGLARALALKPKIMLYDEPTTGLDPITTHMVDDLIISTADNHKDISLTSVVISHDVRATLRVSDYIAFLENGRVVEHCSVEEFKRSTNPTIKRFLEL